MIAIRTRRFRGMVMEREIRIGKLLYTFDRVGTTERALRWEEIEQ